MQPIVNLFEYERLSKARMTQKAFDYYASRAGALLRLAWNAIASKAYPQAEQWLQEGLTLDPSDARLYAYRGVIEEIAGDAATASRYYRMAGSCKKDNLFRAERNESNAI